MSQNVTALANVHMIHTTTVQPFMLVRISVFCWQIITDQLIFFHIPYWRSDVHLNTVFPSAVPLWNSSIWCTSQHRLPFCCPSLELFHLMYISTPSSLLLSLSGTLPSDVHLNTFFPSAVPLWNSSIWCTSQHLLPFCCPSLELFHLMYISTPSSLLLSISGTLPSDVHLNTFFPSAVHLWNSSIWCTSQHLLHFCCPSMELFHLMYISIPSSLLLSLSGTLPSDVHLNTFFPSAVPLWNSSIWCTSQHLPFCCPSLELFHLMYISTPSSLLLSLSGTLPSDVHLNTFFPSAVPLWNSSIWCTSQHRLPFCCPSLELFNLMYISTPSSILLSISGTLPSDVHLNTFPSAVPLWNSSIWCTSQHRLPFCCPSLELFHLMHQLQPLLKSSSTNWEVEQRACNLDHRKIFFLN